MRFKHVLPAVFLSIALITALITPTEYSVFAQSEAEVQAREAQLKAELEVVLREIEDQQKILDAERQKGTSLERDLAILNAQIQKAQLNIRARNLAIAALGKDITLKDQTIKELQDKIESNKESLAQLLRKTNEIDSYNLVDVVLSSQSLSDFFIDADDLAAIKESIGVAMGTIKQSKSQTEVAKQQLDKKRLEEINARISIEDEQAKIKASEKEKARLLSLSKAQQQNYQSQIAQRQQRAAEIRAALFSLRDTSAIPFGKALEYANAASKATGIRPAFLLAILTQESDLGKNVGTCNRPGDPEAKSWKNIMPGPAQQAAGLSRRDDQTIFLQIMKELNMDPNTTPLSCPWGTGWGGAMGPAQFIPTTWNLFKNRIAAATGHNPPSPWNAQDAFMASAIYLTDLGAGTQNGVDERNAACRYYSGRACDNRTPANAFYGDQVLQKARNIQVNMIDPLQGL